MSAKTPLALKWPRDRQTVFPCATTAISGPRCTTGAPLPAVAIQLIPSPMRRGVVEACTRPSRDTVYEAQAVVRRSAAGNRGPAAWRAHAGGAAAGGGELGGDAGTRSEDTKQGTAGRH